MSRPSSSPGSGAPPEQPGAGPPEQPGGPSGRRGDDRAGSAQVHQHAHAAQVTRQLHWLGPLVPLLVGLYALYASYGLGLGELRQPGPGLWPFVVSTVVVATAVILLFVDDPADYETWTRGTLSILGGLVSLGVFILLFQAIGFVIPGVLMLLLWLRLFAGEPWKWAVPLALAGAIGLHLVFVEALGVPFPEGVLLERLRG